MISDKITAHRSFENAHKNLTEITKSKKTVDLQTIISAVRNWENNRDIFKELDYYEENGEVLGRHRKLHHLKLAQDIDQMDRFEAKKRRDNLRTYISRDRKKLKKMKSGPTKDRFQIHLDGMIREREMLEKKHEL